MTVEQILVHLKSVAKFNREQVDGLYRMEKEKGAKMYGSVKDFNAAKANCLGRTIQIEDLINYFEYQIKNK